MHPAARHAPARQRQRQVLLGLCALALLLAQWLGLWHGVAHGWDEPQVALVRHAGGEQGGGHDPFGHHDGAQCRLFDHLAAGHGAPLPGALALPCGGPVGVLAAWFAQSVALPQATPFLARAPPAPGAPA